MNNKVGIKFKIITLVLTFLLLLSSCLPSANNSGSRKKGSSDQGIVNDNPNADPEDPVFSNSSNFFQEGINTSSTTFFLPIDFDDTFFLRGDDVHSFANSNKQTTQCLVVSIPNSLDDQVFVSAALPRFFTNFSNGQREYYYQMNPSNKDLNSSFCQTAGLSASVSSLYPGKTVAFDFDDICPNCVTSIFLRSDKIRLMTSSGITINSINLDALTLSLDLTSQSSNNQNTCSSTSQCTSTGFDCCNDGICIKDGTIKNGVNQNSTEFKQAEQDIANNNANKSDYPNFFNVCTTNPNNDDEEEPDSTELENEASLRFEDLEDLYNCTTLQKGEMSLCTQRYEDASTLGNTFYTGADDRNFNTDYSGTQTIPEHSINRVTYAGETLFENNTFNTTGLTIGPSNSLQGNDNFFDTLELGLTHTKSSSAPHDILKIRYMIDGSCEKISSSLAKCSKFYVQGQNSGDVDDHFPGSNVFKLPFYADLNRTILVHVDGDKQIEGTHWDLNGANYTIDFKGTSLAVFDTQTVEIRFSVDTGTYDVLQSKNLALAEIQKICKCAEPNCLLSQVTDNQGKITDYACVYPPNEDNDAPLQQTVFISSKTVPVRYFDDTGAEQNKIDVSKPDQEGTKFEYTNNDLVLPNNVSSYIGFNEIHGSFTSSGLRSPLPPEKVNVKKGVQYDIFVDNGAFSSCALCGNDYYTNLVRLFPQTFDANKGGGYTPDATATNRSETTTFRGDDQIFGRACYVPVTMIPWTHTDDTERQTQRIRRQNAQHFLFANGYQRDWFGFDYGSVIGSFDGVNWFSVGTQRRITAKSNKLFLAVNTYFGDVNDETSIKVFIQDATFISDAGSSVDNDFDSDGAECRSFHQCETDSDCATQLGWEYTCQSVSQMTTRWPSFDSNANEIPSSVTIKRLATLFDTTGTTQKKCVYRGRGTPCNTSTVIDPTNNSFNGLAERGNTSCDFNNYCQALRDGATDVELFNDRIARFARSPSFQNSSSKVAESSLDTFGKGARQIGRPYKYNGDTAPSVTVVSNLSNNDVNAICIPGRDPNQGNFGDQDSNPPVSQGSGAFDGDQTNGQGMVLAQDEPSNTHFNACPVFDSEGNYYAFQPDFESFDHSVNDNEVTNAALSQVLSTNHLIIFDNLLGDSNKLAKNFETAQITKPTFGTNRCLRAPGSVCHTDLDCAPSKLISGRVDTVATSLTSTLNEFEIKFWQEELVCGQALEKTNSLYELKNNKCCRATGNTLSIASSTVGATEFNTNDEFPGTHKEFSQDTTERYSRLNILKSETTPAISINDNDRCVAPGNANCLDISTLESQFKSLNTIAERTCCSGHWVRNFHETNGSGHSWESSKLQTINKTNLRCYNWVEGTTTFSCAAQDDVDDPDCGARNISNAEAAPILAWLSSFELTGIPQVPIKNGLTNSFDEIECSSVANTIPSNIIASAAVAEYDDASNALDSYLAASDKDNFNSGLKQVFSATDFSCCAPVGTDMGENADSSQCCSGFINGQNNQCALPDFVNLSVYFNRYVSSEAKNVNVSLFDTKTGYISNKQKLVELACNLEACASNLVTFGVGLSNLKVNGKESTNKLRKRFIDGDDEANNFSGLVDLFDNGMKWNNDVYCAPVDLEEIVEEANSGNGGNIGSPVTIFNCNDF